MLELKGVSYRYAGYAKSVLQDVDLTLADGEIVGLVGPNEAGKSTLCLVAAGLAPASIKGALTGTLTIDGEPMAGRKTHELASRVVVGFQNPNTQRSGIAATVFVALGMSASVYLITDFLYGEPWTAIAAALLASGFLVFWYGLPLYRRRRARRKGV